MGGIGIGISPAFGGYAQTYKDKVLGTVPDDLIAYWTLAETSGSTADNAEGTAARDGTYTGVTLNSSTGPDGQPVGLSLTAPKEPCCCGQKSAAPASGQMDQPETYALCA
jgi:hypothetical protein